MDTFKIIDCIEGKAEKVADKDGNLFHPTGYVQIRNSVITEVCLDTKTVLRFAGDMDLFQAASRSVYKACM